MNPSASRVGVLGGTFDPVHNAHLAIARLALEQLGLARILWIPTGAPGYRKPPVAPAADRVAMLRLALAGEPRFVIDERELSPQASGYTVDTLASLQSELPGEAIVFLMGADQYEKRSTWHRWPDVERLCDIAVVARPGSNVDAMAGILHMTPLPVSASDIRMRLARGEDVSAMLPARVLAYIRDKGLYRT